MRIETNVLVHRWSAALILLLFPVFHTLGQTTGEYDDQKNSRPDSSGYHFKDQIVPIGLITGGLIIESLHFKQEIQTWFPRTATKFDDYSQYAPIAILYTSDLFGAEHRNNVFNQTKYLIISELATSLITHTLKRITHVTRPDGTPYSFPSGHTSQSFTCATVLFNETKDYSLPLAGSGYLFSMTTGILRITNNRHWVSDVLVGAGIGILVTNLVYYLEPLRNWDPLKLNGKAVLIPEIDIDSRTYLVSISILIE